jgi:predicted DNA repair protein MutK
MEGRWAVIFGISANGLVLGAVVQLMASRFSPKLVTDLLTIGFVLLSKKNIEK